MDRLENLETIAYLKLVNVVTYLIFSDHAENKDAITFLGEIKMNFAVLAKVPHELISFSHAQARGKYGRTRYSQMH